MGSNPEPRAHIQIWRLPKMRVPPNYPFLFVRFSNIKPSSYWGFPFMETPIFMDLCTEPPKNKTSSHHRFPKLWISHWENCETHFFQQIQVLPTQGCRTSLAPNRWTCSALPPAPLLPHAAPQAREAPRAAHPRREGWRSPKLLANFGAVVAEMTQIEEFLKWWYPQMGMDQYLLIPFLGEWTSIYQLFWCSPGVHGFDTLPNIPKSSETRPSLVMVDAD